MNPNIAIFDLDGTLADDRRRRKLLPARFLTNELPAPKDADYDAYHADCLNDPVVNATIVEFHRAAGHFILFVTARPERFKMDTAEWINRHFPDLPNFSILLRPDGDETPSPALKTRLVGEWLVRDFLPVAPVDDVIALEPLIVAVYDDRKEVLEAFALAGVPGSRMTHIKLPELPHKAAAPSPADCLANGVALFKQRNQTYREAYIGFGDVMAALYPEGLNVAGPDRFAELGVLIQIVSKVTRMTGNKDMAIHLDSVRDLKVYAAMLESLLERNA
jgi:hypothetical protein